MKKLLLGALLVVGLASCSKENVNPVQVQKVTYRVTCGSCLVYVEDNYFNRTDTTQNGNHKSFVVNGTFDYSFENTAGIDTASIEVYTSVFAAAQNIKATINTSDKKTTSLDLVFDIEHNRSKIQLALK